MTLEPAFRLQPMYAAVKSATRHRNRSTNSGAEEARP